MTDAAATTRAERKRALRVTATESCGKGQRLVRVTAASRLHFGLLAASGAGPRRFGGVGLMVAPPRFLVEVDAAPRFRAAGLESRRVAEYADRYARAEGLAELPRCQIRVVSAPPAHVGLGSGTQLGLSVAAALDAWRGLARRGSVELARLVGRGQRSAVGVHGFDHGGMIVEFGKESRAEISPLVVRVALPQAWRFLLMRPQAAHGLHGEAECAALAALPPVPEAVTDELRSIALDELVPAADAEDFPRFSAAVHQFGHLAGQCFESAQGGVYATPRLTQLVGALRSADIVGAAQSSWGPTVFAAFPSEAAAESCAAWIGSDAKSQDLEVAVAAPCARGAAVEVFDDSPGRG